MVLENVEPMIAQAEKDHADACNDLQDAYCRAMEKAAYDRDTGIIASKEYLVRRILNGMSN